ncbi:MAG TPA: nuclear transport factor 2 family protein [Solirubrobacteraceae bacterium]|nr:nuclear transport factor 2 family protein [Solirubrobacteraceae bacterium]
MEASNVERVRRGYEAVMRRDLDALAELLDPAVRWHAGDPDAKYACHNKDEALQFMRRNWLRGGSPGELLDVVGAGEKVVVIMRRAPDDQGSAATVANLTTFRNGKVVEMVHYPDPKDALAAAGVTDS